MGNAVTPIQRTSFTCIVVYMTTSLEIPTSIPSDLVAQLHSLDGLRISAALLFAQETYNGHTERACVAFAKYEQETKRYELLWSAAIRVAEARKGCGA